MIKIQALLDLLKEKNCRYEFTGNPDVQLSGFSSLLHYREGTLAWARDDAALLTTGSEGKISCIILPIDVNTTAQNQIWVSNPREVFFFLIKEFWGPKCKQREVGQGTYVSAEAIIDSTVSIGCNCVIDGEVEIGEGTVVEHNVTLLNRVKIGRKCIIHSGVVIGTDGFGYTYDQDKCPQKIEHFGGVQLGDNVEIGANSCIDRGTIDDTVVEHDTKIDNLVHIAHNVQIGKSVLIVTGACLCGSSSVGDGSYIAPGAIIRDGVHIGKNTLVGMGTVVCKNVQDSTMIYGNPPIASKTQDYRGAL